MRPEIGFLLATFGVILEEFLVRHCATFRSHSVLKSLTIIVSEILAKGTILVVFLARFDDKEPFLFSLVTTYLWESIALIVSLAVVYRTRAVASKLCNGKVTSNATHNS